LSEKPFNKERTGPTYGISLAAAEVIIPFQHPACLEAGAVETVCGDVKLRVVGYRRLCQGHQVYTPHEQVTRNIEKQNNINYKIGIT